MTNTKPQFRNSLGPLLLTVAATAGLLLGGCQEQQEVNEVIASYWRKLDLDVELVTIDYSAFRSRTQSKPQKFDPPVADLTSSEVLMKPDSRLLKSIHEGRPNTAMDSWKRVMSDEATRDVLAYILTFPR